MPANHRSSKQKRGGARPSGLSPVFALFAVVGVGALLVAGLLVLQSKGSSSSDAPDAAVVNGEVPGPKTIDSNPPREADPSLDGPRVYVNASAIDFGVVPLNTEVGYSFDMSNVGSGKLKIGGVSVKVLQGCWPFDPVVGTTTLDSGQKSTISFTTHMMPGMDGPHLFEIHVQTNDPTQPDTVLRVKGDFRNVSSRAQ